MVVGGERRQGIAIGPQVVDHDREHTPVIDRKPRQRGGIESDISPQQNGGGEDQRGKLTALDGFHNVESFIARSDDCVAYL